MSARAGLYGYSNPLRPWAGLIGIVMAAVCALFLVMAGCELKAFAQEPAKDNPPHLCHLEGDWLTVGWIESHRLYGDDHIMVFRTIHGCKCVLFLPDWLGVDGSAYADGELVTARGQMVSGPDRLPRLYVFGINEGSR